MQNIEYQGFGLDLGAFKDFKVSDNSHAAMNTLLATDELHDYSLDHPTERIEIVTSENNPDWDTLIYIPAVVPVIVPGDKQPKIFTEPEAKREIVKTIEWLFLDTRIGNTIWGHKSDNRRNQLTNQFFDDIIDFVEENSDYSWEQDWSDTI